MARAKLAVIRSLVLDAIDNAKETAKLRQSENPQSHAVGMRAEGRLEAYRAISRALDGDTTDLRIAAGNRGRSCTEWEAANGLE